MKLREANIMSYSRGFAFVTRVRGCGLEDIRTPIYVICPEARALVELRHELGLGLHDAASALGIRAIELSGLEHGRLVPVEAGEWAKMMRTLKERR